MKDKLINIIKKSAFTLAEVLLATAIVGIIAGLVLPTTITKFQDRGFSQAYDRNVQAISDAVNSLIVIENKDFFKTEMYRDTAPSNYDETSGKFLKNYMKISKYCGSGSDSAKCFADQYYQHIENRKEVYEPDYTGACAILKNGASICLIPQIGAAGAKGIIDLNGKKGPNIFGRDMREFSLNAKSDKAELDKTQNAVLVTHAPNLGTTDPCDADPQGDECCATKSNITEGDACCNNPTYKTPACDPTPDDPCIANPNGLACCENTGINDSNKKNCCKFFKYKDYPICNPTVTIKLTCKEAGNALAEFGYNYTMGWPGYTYRYVGIILEASEPGNGKKRSEAWGDVIVEYAFDKKAQCSVSPSIHSNIDYNFSLWENGITGHAEAYYFTKTPTKYATGLFYVYSHDDGSHSCNTNKVTLTKCGIKLPGTSQSQYINGPGTVSIQVPVEL